MSRRGRPEREPAGGAEDAEDSAAGRPILVVDDEPTVREYVADALRRQGHVVIVAGSGRDALHAVYGRSPSPAFLLSDVDMPGMSGVELAARLSADRPSMRVILMTGDPDSADLARARPDLVAAVLTKPFSLDDLTRAVREALATAR